MGAIFIFDLFRVKGGIIRGSRQGFLLVTLKFIQQNYLSLFLAVPCHAVLSNAQRVTHPLCFHSNPSEKNRTLFPV